VHVRFLWHHYAVKKIAQKLCSKKQNDRADINRAEIRQNPPYLAQQWFMNARQYIIDHPNGGLPWIHDLENNQPADDQIGKQRPDIDIDDLIDKREKSIHGCDVSVR